MRRPSTDPRHAPPYTVETRATLLDGPVPLAPGKLLRVTPIRISQRPLAAPIVLEVTIATEEQGDALDAFVAALPR